MKRTRFFIHSIPFTALVLTAFVMVPGSAFTQEANEDEAVAAIEEVVKVESLVTSRLARHPSEFGVWTKVFELKKAVSFADLDLQKESDIDELDKRIEDAAKESCKALSETRRLPLWGDAAHRRCVREAIKSTDDELKTAFAAMQ